VHVRKDKIKLKMHKGYCVLLGVRARAKRAAGMEGETCKDLFAEAHKGVSIMYVCVRDRAWGGGERGGGGKWGGREGESCKNVLF
jgi:hypothetical protein